MQFLPLTGKEMEAQGLRSASTAELRVGLRSPDNQAKWFYIVSGFPAAKFQGKAYPGGEVSPAELG